MLLLDDLTTEGVDRTVHSVVHGVMKLEELAPAMEPSDDAFAYPSTVVARIVAASTISLSGQAVCTCFPDSWHQNIVLNTSRGPSKVGLRNLILCSAVG